MSTEEQKAERREDARYYYQRAKRLHKCYVCGAPVDINSKTGKPYSRCPACAKDQREYQREYARRAQKSLPKVLAKESAK